MSSDVAIIDVPKCATEETVPSGILSIISDMLSLINPDFSVNKRPTLIADLKFTLLKCIPRAAELINSTHFSSDIISEVSLPRPDTQIANFSFI